MHKSNPYYDSGKSHHTPTGFRNTDSEVRIGGGFWRWRRERRAVGLPRPPAEGYAAFAERWRIQPDFKLDPSATSRPAVWWLGHATVLLRINGLHIITDPHLGKRASLLPFLGPHRKELAPAEVHALPKIDAVLVSHNHYDHLDAYTVRQLLRANPEVTFYVPLGLAAWLRARGAQHVEELDWWDWCDLAGIEIHCVPAQHWSARTLFDRNRTLWCGWMLRAAGFNFYFSGDTGYTPYLADIAERLGPPDLAALPIGAYEPRWFMRGQHVNPEEAVRLHRELCIRQSLAIHWGTFELADDSLDDPLKALERSLLEQEVSEDQFWVLRQGEARFVPKTWVIGLFWPKVDMSIDLNMKTHYLIVSIIALLLSACVSDNDAWLAKVRTAVPPINGGFHFKQYVVLKLGDDAVLGDEGVLFISPTMLTNSELKTIAESPSGKKAVYVDVAAAHTHLINTCLSAMPISNGNAASAAGYMSLVLTVATSEKDGRGIRFRVYTWPDFWYDWHVKQAGNDFTVEDSSTRNAFGWESSRIELVRDASVTMDTCLKYNIH